MIIMNIKNKGLLLPLFLSGISSMTAMAQQRPNIIYIFIDQQTASAMSCTGNLDLNTPNMDRLAANGIRFENAYCSAPLSGPSRSAMFTGHYPGTIGMLRNGANMPDSINAITLGTLMSAGGYDCVYGGKWHIPVLDIPDGEFGFSQLHPHTDYGLAESCVEYISQKHDKPFFLVASFDNPHNICEYARKQNLPYGNIQEPDIRDCPGLPVNFAKNPYDAGVIEYEKRSNFNVYPSVDYTLEDWRKYRYVYYRLVEKIDKEIGKIIDAIDDKNLWKNTIVIFSSDHGDGIGAHSWNQKSALYEEVINIPLIVSLPGKKHAGTVLSQIVNNGVDFFATICDFAGIECPKSSDGISFKKVLENGTSSFKHKEYNVTETLFDGGITRGWALRTARYKYVIYDKGNNREQMFDMIYDKGEMRNLVVEEAYHEELEHLRDLMDQWMRMNNIKPSRRQLNDVPERANR